MRMIGKLGEDKKANLPGHLAEIVHIYNATHYAMTGYSPHYLMFGQRPRLPVNFCFPNFRSAGAPVRQAYAKHVDEYVATVHKQLRTTLWEAQGQSTAEAQWQKWYYDQMIDAMDLMPGNLFLVKDDSLKGKRKIRDRWEEETCEVVCHIVTDIPPWNDRPMQTVMHPPPKPASSHHVRGWHSLVYRCLSCMGQMYHPHSMQANFQGKCRYDDTTRE